MVKPRKKSTPTFTDEEEPVVVAEPKATPKTKTLKEVASMFPEATTNLTQRWYGETFYPKYVEALAELKKLAK